MWAIRMPKRQSIPRPVSMDALLSRLPPLTEKERTLVSLKLLTMVQDGGGAPLTDVAIARQCGYRHPAANAARVFGRPRVRQAMALVLEALGVDPMYLAKRLKYWSNSEVGNLSLRALETILKLRGELGPSSKNKAPSAANLLALSSEEPCSPEELQAEYVRLLALAAQPPPAVNLTPNPEPDGMDE